MDEQNRDVNEIEAGEESLEERFASAKKRRKKVLIITVAVVIAGAALLIGILQFVGKSGVNKTLDAYMEAFESKEYNAVTDLLSSYYSALKLSDVSIADNIKYFNKVIDNAHANFENNLGEDYILSYEVTSQDNMSAKEFDAMVNALSFGVYNAKDIITEATRVEVTITAEKDDNEMTHVISLLLTKEEDEWFILDIK